MLNSLKMVWDCLGFEFEFDLFQVQEGKLRAYEEEQERLNKMRQQEATRNMYALSIKQRYI